jgi:hypothetical protein
MLSSLAAAAVLLAVAEGSAPDFRPPPLPRNPLCVCTDRRRASDVMFAGYVVDAEVRAKKDGTGVEPRQATVFRLRQVMIGDVVPEGDANTIRVWHTTDPRSCGVRFDYGQLYVVKARKKKDALETDACMLEGLANK